MKMNWLLSGCLIALYAIAGSEHVALGQAPAANDTAVGKAATQIAVGDKAPDFTMTGIDGKEIKLSELTATGKNVVLLFDRAHW